MDPRLRPEQSLTFDRFWTWIQEHPNCVLRCGSADVTLFDHDDFHWLFFDEEERRAVVQLLKGKDLVGELVMAGREVREVALLPDPEAGAEGHVLAELTGGPKEDPQVLFHFLLSHGFEPESKHQGFKH